MGPFFTEVWSFLGIPSAQRISTVSQLFGCVSGFRGVGRSDAPALFPIWTKCERSPAPLYETYNVLLSCLDFFFLAPFPLASSLLFFHRQCHRKFHLLFCVSQGQWSSAFSANCNYLERFEKIARPGPHPQRYYLIGVEWTPGVIALKGPQVILTCSGVWKHCLRASLQNKGSRVQPKTRYRGSLLTQHLPATTLTT